MDGARRKGVKIEAGARAMLQNMAAGDSDAGWALWELLVNGNAQSSVQAGARRNVAFTKTMATSGPALVAMGDRIVAAYVRPLTSFELSSVRGRGMTADPRGQVRSLAEWFDDDQDTVDAYNAVIVDVRDITDWVLKHRPAWAHPTD